jgi:hypothetical protein
MRDPKTVRPEPVEGLSCLADGRQGKGFDKLSPNGFSLQRRG